VNRKATTPEGAAAVDMLTEFHKERRVASNISGIGPVTRTQVL